MDHLRFIYLFYFTRNNHLRIILSKKILKKNLSVNVDAKFILNSLSQCLEKIINLNNIFLENNPKRKKAKKNLSADAARNF